MIVYVSESLNSKKHGGSSLSGLDFLQILRVHYKDVNVVSYDYTHMTQQQFYGNIIHSLGKVTRLKTLYKPKTFGLLRRIKQCLIFLQNLFKPSTINYSGKQGLLFVNSWSTIMESHQLLNIEGFRKICVVRGNPESFIWQGKSQNGQQNIVDAADYLNLFDDLVFVSSSGMQGWQPYLREQINSHYLPNSIDEHEVNALISSSKDDFLPTLGFKKDILNLVAIGSVQTRKGQDMLLKVAEYLAKENLTFTIHIVGVVSNQWGGNKIKQVILTSTMASNFVFHGHREDALTFARCADICLFPSRAEAFPRTVAEYMALGSAIVSTDVSGVTEMIEHGVNGMLCAQDDSQKMAEYIVLLANNSQLCEKLKEAARTRYLNSFAKRHQIARAIDIFNKL